MPWQAHIFIGKKVATYDDIRQIAKELNLSVKIDEDVDDGSSITSDNWHDAVKKKKLVIPLVYKGKTYKFKPEFKTESEGGSTFPNSQVDTYTDAMVGFALTTRYAPTLLDKEFANGRPEPFELNLNEMQDLLSQVRKAWPTASIYMWDIWH